MGAVVRSRVTTPQFPHRTLVAPATSGMALRAPQQQALAILEAKDTGSTTRIQMPPGTGKTHMSLTFVQNHPLPLPHLFIANGKDLAYDTHRYAQKLGIQSQLLGDSSNDIDVSLLKNLTSSSSCQLVVAIVHSLHRLPKDLRFGLKVLDEAHHYREGGVYRQRVDAVPCERTVELSATFIDQHDLDMSLSVDEAITGGYITDYQVHFGIFERLIDRHVATLQLVQRHLEEWSPMFCYYNSTASAQRAQDVFAAAGIRAVSLTGESTQLERDGVAAEVRGGTLDVVCLCGVWNESVSHHRLRTVIFAEPRNSETNKKQVAFRANRLYPDKPFYRIVFVCSQADMHDQSVRRTIRAFATADSRLAQAIRTQDRGRIRVEAIGFDFDIGSSLAPGSAASEAGGRAEEEQLCDFHDAVYDRLGGIMPHLNPAAKMQALVDEVAACNGCIPAQKDTSTIFADGTRMGQFWTHCKDRSIATRSPEAYAILKGCAELRDDYAQFEAQGAVRKMSVMEKMQALADEVAARNGCIPAQKDTGGSTIFADGTRMGEFWSRCKRQSIATRRPEAYAILKGCTELQDDYAQFEAQRGYGYER
jgi:superfamily II DNA or RNA helicase